MSFLPPGYEVPKTQGDYMKFEKGDNRFRILSKAITGYEYWTKENKPVRSHDPFDDVPADAKLEKDPKTGGSSFKPKHFWAFVVYNYKAGKIQILEITQSTVMEPIANYVKDEDWGSPEKYDIVVSRSGEGMETDYQVKTKPHSEIPEEVKAHYRTLKIDLSALYEGGDPFKGTLEDGEVNPDDIPF
jgi:hypothetical protein